MLKNKDLISETDALMVFKKARHEKIKTWLINHGIKNFEINPDESINVNSDVCLRLQANDIIEDIPKFHHIKGDFDCKENGLIDLRFAPQRVEGNFDCSKNQLYTLKGSPEYVGDSFICRENLIYSLEGCSTHIENILDVRKNPQLKLLNGFPIGENLKIRYSAEYINENMTEVYNKNVYYYFGDQEVLATEIEKNIKQYQYADKMRYLSAQHLKFPVAHEPEKFLKNKNEIIQWLKEHDIHHYDLVKNKEYGYVVNARQRVFLADANLTFIPVKFHSVTDDFVCANNKLSSLEFSPLWIDGNFFCENNQLKSLEFCPQIIKGAMECCDNPISTFEYFPQYVEKYVNMNRTPILENLFEKSTDFHVLRQQHLNFLNKIKFKEDLEEQLTPRIKVKTKKL